MDDNEKLQRHRTLKRRRRLVCLGFLPVGLALLVLPRLLMPDMPQLLTWILLLGFAVICVMLMHSTDECPWCGKSFYAGEKSSDSASVGSLLRDNCASCGKPGAIAADSDDGSDD